MKTRGIFPCAMLVVGLGWGQAAFTQTAAPADEDLFDLLAPLAQAEDEQVPQVDAPPAPNAQPLAESDDPKELPEFPAQADVEPHIVEAPEIPPVEAPEVPLPPPQPQVVTQQVRLLLAPSPEAQGDAARIPLLVQRPGLLTRLSPDELHVLLAMAVQDCLRDLEDIQYGDRWQTFLRLEQLQEFLAVPVDVANETAVRHVRVAGIEPIRGRFAQVATDAKYRTVTARPSVRAVHLTLNEYVAPPDDRQRRREIFDELQRLSASLRPAASGRQWHSFFELGRLEQLLALPGPPGADNLAQLKRILVRFDQTANQTQFRTVVALPGFTAVHERLERAIVLLEQPRTSSAAAARLAGRPVPEGAGPLLRLVGEEGRCFHRPPQGEDWSLIEEVQPIVSGGSVRTAEGAAARLLVGEDSHLLIAPDTTFSVTQHVDDSNRVVTTIHATSGRLNLRIGETAPLDAADEAAAASSFAGRRIVVRAEDFRIAAGESRLSLEVRLVSGQRRAYATVHEGKVEIVNDSTGDRVMLQPGREAVLVPQGVALRAAGEEDKVTR